MNLREFNKPTIATDVRSVSPITTDAEGRRWQMFQWADGVQQRLQVGIDDLVAKVSRRRAARDVTAALKGKKLTQD